MHVQKPRTLISNDSDVTSTLSGSIRQSTYGMFSIKNRITIWINISRYVALNPVASDQKLPRMLKKLISNVRKISIKSIKNAARSSAASHRSSAISRGCAENRGDAVRAMCRARAHGVSYSVRDTRTASSSATNNRARAPNAACSCDSRVAQLQRSGRPALIGELFRMLIIECASANTRRAKRLNTVLKSFSVHDAASARLSVTV